MKFCRGCETEKPIHAFSKRSDRPSGVQARCKACSKAYMDRNREKQRERVTKRHHERKADVAYVKSRRATSAAWKKNNKNRVNEAWRIRDQDRRNSDLNYRLRRNMRSRLKRYFSNKAGSVITDLGCSVPHLITYLEDQWESGMSWQNYGTEWEIDHIEPLAIFDLADRKQFLKACHYSNLQPLWCKEHRRKTAKDLTKMRKMRK